MGGGVGGRDHAAVRVAEQEHPLEPEVRAQLVEVCDVVGGLVCARVGRTVGALGPPGVEHDERERRAEAREIAEVPRREPGPAGVADEQRPLALAPVRERSAVGRAERLHAARLVDHSATPGSIRPVSSRPGASMGRRRKRYS